MKRASHLAFMFVAALTSLAAAQATVKITVDTSKAPDFAEYGQKVQAVSEEWYPKIAEMLPSDGWTAPTEITIVFDPDYKGVAACAGTRIVASTKWFGERPEDVGAFVHELVHVVQQYRGGERPGWLTEGIADYIRWFVYEPESARPRPNPEKSRHSDSYRTSGHFLDWAQKAYDPELVKKLNAACREARYSEDLWKEYTGKTLEELGAEWKATLK
jgi:hypothetical protein